MTIFKPFYYKNITLLNVFFFELKKLINKKNVELSICFDPLIKTNKKFEKSKNIKLSKKYLSQIENALISADNFKSKLTYFVLFMDGMSGRKTRHFYNNICSEKNIRYLEIGSWKGSTICSAMQGNQINGICIDNWSEFGGPKNVFLKNFKKCRGKNKVEFIECDCWLVDVNSLGKFNIYMYDGNHTEASHYRALNYYLSNLDEQFIYLVDDCNFQDVRKGTLNAIKENKIDILYQKEIITNTDNKHSLLSGVDSFWHNGISIFILQL